MMNMLRITVFGGSSPKPDDVAYRDAQKLGRLLAEAGFSVQTGGYIGTMEAVSRGAAQAGGHVIGITCEEIERWRPVNPNPWVIEEERYPTLKLRLFALIENCDAAISLPGGIGTLQEIVVMWSQLQIGAISPKPLILVGEAWEQTIRVFYQKLGFYISQRDRMLIRFSENIDASVQLLKTMLSHP